MEIDIILILTQIRVGLTLVWLLSIVVLKEFGMVSFSGSQVRFCLPCHVSEDITIMLAIGRFLELLILLQLNFSAF